MNCSLHPRQCDNCFDKYLIHKHVLDSGQYPSMNVKYPQIGLFGRSFRNNNETYVAFYATKVYCQSYRIDLIVQKTSSSPFFCCLKRELTQLATTRQFKTILCHYGRFCKYIYENPKWKKNILIERKSRITKLSELLSQSQKKKNPKCSHRLTLSHYIHGTMNSNKKFRMLMYLNLIFNFLIWFLLEKSYPTSLNQFCLGLTENDNIML